MHNTTDSAPAATIAFAHVLALFDGLDHEQEGAVAQYMTEQFPEAFDDDGEEVPGLLEAETRFVALVRELQAQAVDAIAVIVGAAQTNTQTNARS